MDKDTTLICTIGDAIKIFHSTERAQNMYENKRHGHEIIVKNFTDEDFERLENKLRIAE